MDLDTTTTTHAGTQHAGRAASLPPFAATAVGSMPHTDPTSACRLVQRWLPEIPAWPQLPRRDFREAIYAQYGAGFPGVVLDAGQGRIYVDRACDLDAELEQLYARYLAGDVDGAALPPEHAAGLAHFSALDWGAARAVKGQVIGPVSWGLTLTDTTRRSVLYDDVLADALARHLRLAAAWQERELRRLGPQTIVFVDEPYLASLGSAYVAVPRELVRKLLDEVIGGLTGLVGVHCCGNTDWPLLLEAPIDILSFDAYDYAGALALYPAELSAFLERGGRLAWGIVPVADDAAVLAQTAAGLVERLAAVFAVLAAKGIPLERLAASALLTPACGMGTLSEAGAERALELLAEVSRLARRRFGSDHG
jgi:methionine synthase II (cobalamin-independent)